ncbi:MAG: sulfhydrogenase subunit delta [Gammaproteobacteria bacterium]|nr:sulfhydrogenase subunit delta [Gammaproteobacteria bacterium]
MSKPGIAVHKFSSCDGCQLAFLNAGSELLTLATLVDIRHFLEAGVADEDAQVDIAFVEGSISTADEVERIRRVRANSRLVITLGACATAGGLQALRNLDDSHEDWKQAIYAQPEFITTLDHATPVKAHIDVDYELWGCPVNGRQVLAAVRQLLFGVAPRIMHDKVCVECKRQQAVCVMVTDGQPCMGPVTQTGCGALCPRFGRDCYACFGPADDINVDAMSRRLEGLGLPPADVARRFLFINSHAPAFLDAGLKHYRPGFDDD